MQAATKARAPAARAPAARKISSRSVPLSATHAERPLSCPRRGPDNSGGGPGFSTCIAALRRKAPGLGHGARGSWPPRPIRPREIARPDAAAAALPDGAVRSVVPARRFF